MLTGPRRRAVAGLAAAAALGTACTRAAPDAVNQANRIAATGPERTVAITAATPTVEPRPGGVAPHAVPWVDAAVARDGRSLVVRYEAACDWLDRVDVAESGDRVAVTVYLATDPAFATTGDGPLTACAAPPRYDAVPARLARPLRGRLVVDASTGPGAARPVVRIG